MAQTLTTPKLKKLNEPELEQVYGGAGEIKSNYLAVALEDTKAQDPQQSVK